jgi:hypothetical protein
MDAAEWDASTDLWTMTTTLWNRTTQRKARLVVCAYARQDWQHLADERLRTAVEVGERFADGKASFGTMELAHSAAATACNPSRLQMHSDAWTLAANARDCSERFTRTFCEVIARRGQAGATAVLVHLLRDVFGNPFRPVAFDPAWRAGPVPGLAEAAYTERIMPSGELDAARLAILADALEDNGADPTILAHLRGPGPHVRGCWVVDRCTGRG